MMAVTMATLKKELREVLRDKRTLFLTILVPLVFYPALILLASGLGAKQEIKTKQQVLRVGICGEAADSVSPQLVAVSHEIEWNLSPREDVETQFKQKNLDAYVVLAHRSDHLTAEVHYLSTVQGELLKKRVLDALKAYKDEVVKSSLGEVLEVSQVDHASARQSAGSKFGGVVAYFIVFLAFTGCMAVAVDAAAGEKERGTLEAILSTSAPFSGIALGKLLYIVVMGLLSVASTAGGIGIMVLLNGTAAGALSGVDWWAMLGMFFLLLVLVFFFAAVLFAVSMTARSNKEAHMRSSLLMLLLCMSLVYCTLPGGELSGAVLYVPALNVAMALKELWQGTLGMLEYFIVLGFTLGLAVAVLAWISIKVKYQPEKVLLK